MKGRGEWKSDEHGRRLTRFRQRTSGKEEEWGEEEEVELEVEEEVKVEGTVKDMRRGRGKTSEVVGDYATIEEIL